MILYIQLQQTHAKNTVELIKDSTQLLHNVSVLKDMDRRFQINASFVNKYR